MVNVCEERFTFLEEVSNVCAFVTVRVKVPRLSFPTWKRWKVFRTEGFATPWRQAAFFLSQFRERERARERKEKLQLGAGTKLFHGSSRKIHCNNKCTKTTCRSLVNTFKFLANCHSIQGVKHFHMCCYRKIINPHFSSPSGATNHTPQVFLFSYLKHVLI